MLTRWNQNSRLCVLEASNKAFQESMSDHMKNEESAFKDMQKSIKDVISHIDKAQKENSVAIHTAQKENYDALHQVKKEILGIMDKEFVGKLEVERELTGLRKSIEQKIERDMEKKAQEDERDKKRSATEVGIIVTVAIGAIGGTATFCVWVYNNVHLIGHAV